MDHFTRRSLLSKTAVGAATLSSAAAATRTLATPSPKAAPRPTLIKGADLLTMDPKLGEMRGADVLIQGGKIAAIGQGLKAADAEVVEAQRMILMPGMSDGHRHTWMDVEPGAHVKFDPKGYSDYQNWKLRTMAVLTPEDHYLGTLFGALLAIDSGVTTMLDFPHGQVTLEQALGAARGARDSGIGGWHAFQLGITLDIKPGQTSSYADANDRYMSPAEPKHWAMAEAVRNRLFNDSAAQMQFAMGVSNVKNISLEGMKTEITRIRAMGVKLIAIHVVGATHTIREMNQYGLLGPDMHYTHANLLDDEELKMVADTGGTICSSSMGEIPYVSWGWGPPVPGRARAAGVPVGIGVDVPEAVTQDYFEHVRAAFWTLFLSPQGQKLSFDYKSADVLDFATNMGARALHLGDVSGSVTVGKRADLVLLRTDRAGFPDRGSLADRVVTFGALQDVDSVWIVGEARKRHGKLVGHDLAKLKVQLAKAQARFRPLADSTKLL